MSKNTGCNWGATRLVSLLTLKIRVGILTQNLPVFLFHRNVCHNQCGDATGADAVLNILIHMLYAQTDPELKHTGKRYVRVPMTITQTDNMGSPVDNSSFIAKDFPFLLPSRYGLRA